jgi:ketosteroid isomerase-like protein
MRISTLFFLLFFQTALCAQKKTTTHVIDLMKVQEKFWNAGDLEGFMKYYWKSDSLKFVGKSGITYGWQKTLDNYRKSYPNKEAMGTLTFEINSAEMLSNNSVFIIGKWSLEREKSIGGYFTLLWKKIKGEWLIVADHTS